MEQQDISVYGIGTLYKYYKGYKETLYTVFQNILLSSIGCIFDVTSILLHSLVNSCNFVLKWNRYDCR